MLPMDQMQPWAWEVQRSVILSPVLPLRGAEGSQWEEVGQGYWIPGG